MAHVPRVEIVHLAWGPLYGVAGSVSIKIFPSAIYLLSSYVVCVLDTPVGTATWDLLRYRGPVAGHPNALFMA